MLFSFVFFGNEGRNVSIEGKTYSNAWRDAIDDECKIFLDSIEFDERNVEHGRSRRSALLKTPPSDSKSFHLFCFVRMAYENIDVETFRESRGSILTFFLLGFHPSFRISKRSKPTHLKMGMGMETLPHEPFFF